MVKYTFALGLGGSSQSQIYKHLGAKAASILLKVIYMTCNDRKLLPIKWHFIILCVYFATERDTVSKKN